MTTIHSPACRSPQGPGNGFAGAQCGRCGAGPGMACAGIKPVDQAHGAAVTLTDGSAVTADHREINPATGQQKAYVVLSDEERATGFVRPVRRSYVHSKCGVVTTMGQALAETYARQPDFYSGTFCCGCGSHFPVGAAGEFVWDGSDEKVGT